MTRARSRWWAVSGAALAGSLLVGCMPGTTDPGDDDASPTVSSTTTPETPTTSAAPTDEDPVVEETGDPSASESQVIITGGAQELTLADVFSASEAWQEGEFDPAGQVPAAQAIGAVLDCQEWEDPAVLDLRFGSESTGNLVVDVAQDITSEASTGVVEFVLKVDDRQLDTTNVGLKESDQLTTPLTNVASVKVEASQVEQTNAECEGTVTALITRLAIEDPGSTPPSSP